MDRSTVASSLLVLPLLLAPAAYASTIASPNRHATGTFSEPIAATSRTIAGHAVVITESIRTTYSGDMAGMAELTETETASFNGATSFHVGGTFMGGILGSVGTCHEAYSGTGSAASFKGHGELKACTAGLAGLSGLGTFHGAYTSKTSADGSYSLLVHF